MMVMVMMVVAMMAAAMTAAAVHPRGSGCGDGCACAIDHLARCGREKDGGKGCRDKGGQDFFVHGLARLGLS
jgi:hypothetical protein